ncbi:MAG: endonuclease [Lachnospiraceae bacterium]|nr:endonuclease [Lachnospiraceae bacterium]
MKKPLKITLKVLLWIIAASAGAFVLMILWLTIREYRPAEKEALSVESSGAGTAVSLNEEIRIMTWNVGCGVLGDNADFFMDGGSMVYTADKDRARSNLSGICETLSETGADIILLQEADRDASRSYHIDETAIVSNLFPEYDHTYAYNFHVDYVPYPIPPIGEVKSGLLTLSRFGISSAERIQLPCPFKWPTRVANLKRCLSVNRIPIEGSGSQLVIVNLHLEAYDDGEGKEAQTRMLCEFLENEVAAGNYVIAGGDFNQTFSGTDASAYPAYEDKWHPGILDESAFPGSFTFLQDPSSPSCRSLDQPYDTASDKEHFQFYVIDGFIVSSGIEVIRADTVNLNFRNTDHNPVVMDVIIH